MKHLINAPAFGIFFFVSYATFFIVTMVVFDHVEEALSIGHTIHGFPFGYYYSGCFGGYYIWSGLIGNAAVGATISLGTALALAHFRLKLRDPEFRAKWYL